MSQSLLFDDGTVGNVDFSVEEWRGVLEPLGDPKYFARVRVDPEARTVTWPNGEDLAPEPLMRSYLDPLATGVLGRAAQVLD